MNPCRCRRYATPCIEKTTTLLCHECHSGRCVVIEFRDEGVPTREHLSADNLIIDPEETDFDVGARVIRP